MPPSLGPSRSKGPYWSQNTVLCVAGLERAAVSLSGGWLWEGEVDFHSCVTAMIMIEVDCVLQFTRYEHLMACLALTPSCALPHILSCFDITQSVAFIPSHFYSPPSLATLRLPSLLSPFSTTEIESEHTPAPKPIHSSTLSCKCSVCEYCCLYSSSAYVVVRSPS